MNIRKLFQGDMSDYEFKQLCADAVAGIVAATVLLGAIAAMNYFGALS